MHNVYDITIQRPATEGRTHYGIQQRGKGTKGQDDAADHGDPGAQGRDVEQHFTLVGSGHFAPGDGNGLPLPYSPSHRRVEAGDSVAMEITPCLERYWTQLVRTVNVGAPNPELEKLHRVARDAIKKGLEVFRPGKTVRDVVLAIIGHVESSGTAVIIHPTVFTSDGKNSFFWGETYLVTDDGYERLNHATNELLTV
jgi:hypothetical protein